MIKKKRGGGRRGIIIIQRKTQKRRKDNLGSPSPPSPIGIQVASVPPIFNRCRPFFCDGLYKTRNPSQNCGNLGWGSGQDGVRAVIRRPFLRLIGTYWVTVPLNFVQQRERRTRGSLDSQTSLSPCLFKEALMADDLYMFKSYAQQ